MRHLVLCDEHGTLNDRHRDLTDGQAAEFNAGGRAWPYPNLSAWEAVRFVLERVDLTAPGPPVAGRAAPPIATATRPPFPRGGPLTRAGTPIPEPREERPSCTSPTNAPATIGEQIDPSTRRGPRPDRRRVRSDDVRRRRPRMALHPPPQPHRRRTPRRIRRPRRRTHRRSRLRLAVRVGRGRARPVLHRTHDHGHRHRLVPVDGMDERAAARRDRRRDPLRVLGVRPRRRHRATTATSTLHPVTG